ncbi:hypothetical protein H0H87_011632 [Tephrocybe sp. NHM501043]|nr:hypothetical protein H0H87_011632 [Tephrocybe sp. NHM501043]
MRLLRAFVATLTATSVLPIAAIAGSSKLVTRDADFGISGDVCGEVDADLSVPNLLSPGKYINLGHIKECLCLSTLPYFLATHPLALAALALVGEDKTNQLLTDLVHGCPGQTCKYPPHSVPACQEGNPCGFTCKDGYTPYPDYKPTQCICKPPYTECNGKCGQFQGCPSGYLVKRDALLGKRCPAGFTACGIPSRGAGSWECLDIQTELESCGGCALSLYGEDIPEGEDCTAIPGVADVSCVRGGCKVHRCMPGYEVTATGASCSYVEDHDPVLLAAQYGLEHVPL